MLSLETGDPLELEHRGSSESIFCPQSILHHLTIQLGHGWCRQAEIETEELIQIKVKLGVLEHLHQIIEKFAISE